MLAHPYPSPIGTLTLIGDERAVHELRFPGRGGRQLTESDRGPIPATMGAAIEQLDAYFAGELDHFELALELDGTPFQRRVWDALQEIPYGVTTTYGALARTLGGCEPRAVGGAVGATPVPIVVPCHRVIGADGSLTGYGGGLDRKRTLLAFEASGGNVPTLHESWNQRQLAML